MPLTGFSSSTVSSVLYDSGIVVIGGIILSASRGGVWVTHTQLVREVEFDGRRHPVDGLDRLIATIIEVSGTFIQFGTVQIAHLEHNVAGVLAGGVTTTTPLTAGTMLTTGQYVSNLDVRFSRGTVAGDVLEFRMARALVRYAIAGEDNGEAGIDVSFMSRLDAATAAAA